jgi:toxin ParE1/3/4
LGKVERSIQAKRDLLDIWMYLAEGSQRAADRLLDQFETTLKLLASHPGMGKLRDELAPGLRSFIVGDYLIFYLPRERDLLLVRVLSGYRDLDSLFE